MGMDLLAVSPTANARRFKEDGFSIFNKDSWPEKTVAFVVAPTDYRLPPHGPLRKQIEKRAGAVVPGEYSRESWLVLLDALAKWGVDTSSFPRGNEGKVISGSTCRRVAEVMEKNLSEYIQCIYPDWDSTRAFSEALEDVVGWRTCGGYAVW